MRGGRSTLAAACVALSLWLTASASLLQAQEAASEWDVLMMFNPPDEAESGTAHKGKRRRHEASQKARANRSRAASYAMLKESWHAPVEDGSWDEGDALIPLVLRKVGHDEPCVLTPASRTGGFDSEAVARATELFGGWPGGPSVSPRLLDLIYAATRHFEVRQVHVVSGLRRDRSGSRHSHGLAADVVLPGIRDEALAEFFRAQGFVGVGTYTRAGFVHIDVREASYFWIDSSPPGSKRVRQRQINAAEGKLADALALERGQGPNLNPERLQRALHQRATRRARVVGRRKHRVREDPQS